VGEDMGPWAAGSAGNGKNKGLSQQKKQKKQRAPRRFLITHRRHTAREQAHQQTFKLFKECTPSILLVDPRKMLSAGPPVLRCSLEGRPCMGPDTKRENSFPHRDKA
jgi:hypothetical protein